MEPHQGSAAIEDRERSRMQPQTVVKPIFYEQRAGPNAARGLKNRSRPTKRFQNMTRIGEIFVDGREIEEGKQKCLNMNRVQTLTLRKM